MQLPSGSAQTAAPDMNSSVDTLPSASLAAAQSARAKKLAEFEERRLARSLIVPTNDGEVRVQLRKRGVPVCYFGEDAHDRRERLRTLMAKEILESKARTEADQSANHPQTPESKAESVAEEQKGEQKVTEEEFYTEGSDDLKQFRMEIARPSLLRAARRLAWERAMQQENDSGELRVTYRKAEKRAVDAVRNSNMLSSQGGEGRPLSAISVAENPWKPTENIVATGSWGGVVTIWEAARDCEQVQTFRQHNERLSTVHFPRHSASLLFSASADATACVFRACEEKKSFTHAHTFKEHTARVTDIKLHPFRKSLICTSSLDGTVHFYDSDKLLLRQETGHKQVYRVSFHPDGGLFGTCGLDGSIRLWDVRSGRAVLTLEKAHVGDVLGIEFSGDGRVLASGGNDNMVRIWDVRFRRCIKQIAAHTSLVSCVRFGGGVGNCDVLVTGSFDKSVKCWSARRDWAFLKAHTVHEDKVTAVDCTADGSIIVSACYDKTWKMWGADNATMDHRD